MSGISPSLRWMTAEDGAIYARMAHALWPELSYDQHLQEFNTQIKCANKRWGVLASTPELLEAGFADLSLRQYVDGCTQSPVPMLEGIWVCPELRQHGIARAMVEFISDWARTQGYCELCSDTQIDNLASQKSHEAWGFTETQRIVLYRKPIL